MEYEWVALDTQSLDTPVEVRGRVVAVSNRGDQPFTRETVAFVELPADSEVPVEDDSEGVTCAGKDGECSRDVDEPGETCWQHE